MISELIENLVTKSTLKRSDVDCILREIYSFFKYDILGTVIIKQGGSEIYSFDRKLVPNKFLYINFSKDADIVYIVQRIREKGYSVSRTEAENIKIQADF